MRWLPLVLLAACVEYDAPWQLRAGLATQGLARGDLGLAAGAPVDDVWISLHAWDSGDVAYPVVEDGGGLVLRSPEDTERATLLTWTRLSNGTEPAEDHPDTQYATLFVDALLDDHVETMQLDLELAVGGDCAPPPIRVTGTVLGCLGDPDCAEETRPLAYLDDRAYAAGPLRLTLEVLPHNCAE